MSADTAWLASLQELQRTLQAGFSRTLVWISGQPDWVRARLNEGLRTLPAAAGPIITNQRTWNGLDSTRTGFGLVMTPLQQTERLLGQEYPWLVYDAFSGVNPDALGRVAGLVKGGGLLFYLSASTSDPAFFQDPQKRHLCVYPCTEAAVANRFLQHLATCLNTPDVFCIDQYCGLRPTCLDLPAPTLQAALAQQQDWLQHTFAALQQPRSAHVLSAPRGRGKSAALGMLAQLAGRAGWQVDVTAPSKAAITCLRSHAEEAMPRFLLPTAVLQQPDPGQLLLVDEAATIAVPLLARFAKRYRHIVYATTTDGYEGTGQGFALRFLLQLQKLRPELSCQSLHYPIRWAAADPLEALTNRLLLLTPPRFTYQLPSALRYYPIDRDDLLAHPTQLAALFGLLVDAHYRTTPGDLRILLDSPNISVWVASAGEQIVAALLVAVEGQLPADLSEQIWQGRRRPRGHLIPQLLVAQEGHREAASLRIWRVVRIAVADSCRRCGIGEALLGEVRKAAMSQQVDLLGAAFALTADLLAFWDTLGFLPVRVGTQLDPISGSYATLVLCPLSTPATTACSRWRVQFARYFPYLQRGWLQYLEPSAKAFLPASVPEQQCALPSVADWQLLYGFACHHRPYPSSAPAFALLAQACPGHWQHPALSPLQQHLIQEYVIGQASEACMLENYPINSTRALHRLLRQAAATFYQHACQANVVDVRQVEGAAGGA